MTLLNWFKTEVKLNSFFNNIPPLSNSLPVIAGGAALQLYTGGSLEDCRDIDVFFDNTTKAKKFINKLGKISDNKISYIDLGWSEDERFNQKISDNYVCSKTLSTSIDGTYYEMNFILQPSLKWKRDKVQKLIDLFDFTVCQVATNGTEFILGDRTQEDILDKRLSFIDYDERVEFISNPTVTLVGSGYYQSRRVFQDADNKLEIVLSRIQKYKNKGFQPDEDMLQFVLKYG